MMMKRRRRRKKKKKNKHRKRTKKKKKKTKKKKKNKKNKKKRKSKNMKKKKNKRKRKKKRRRRRRRKFKRCSKRAVDHFRKWLPIKNYLARLEICPTNLPNSKEFSLSNEISEVNLNAYKRILNWQPFMKKVHRKIM